MLTILLVAHALTNSLKHKILHPSNKITYMEDRTSLGKRDFKRYAYYQDKGFEVLVL